MTPAEFERVQVGTGGGTAAAAEGKGVVVWLGADIDNRRRCGRAGRASAVRPVAHRGTTEHGHARPGPGAGAPALSTS